jgi:4-diphosphocytidyl-2-C-methyl-D-erythritol kinase
VTRKIRIPAKINLWLEVVGRRSDGYHELSSLMVPVGIYDELTVKFRAGNSVHVDCPCPGVPSDQRNIAWRAADRYLSAAGISRRLDISIRKEIPVGAGMGGGSADAAAVLLALDSMLNGLLSITTLREIAVGLGADVPFFLQQRPAMATGIGENLVPVEGVPDYPLLLIKPPYSVSTAKVYGSLRLTKMQPRIKLRTFLAMPWMLRDVLENDLESVTISDHPQVGEIKQWLLSNGAVAALMTGSGPTVFGIFSDKAKVGKVAHLAKQVWNDCWIAVSEVLPLIGTTANLTGYWGVAKR